MPDPPGALVKSGDIDNRIKTLLDALRMITSKDELGGYVTPQDDEKPFFVLLEDDRLITQLAVETDTLLQPIAPASQLEANDTRLVITVRLAPIQDHNPFYTAERPPPTF